MVSTEPVIFISDDDDDDDDGDDNEVVLEEQLKKQHHHVYIKNLLKTQKRKKSLEEGDDDDDDDDVIWIENRVEECGNKGDVVIGKKRISSSDEDCCILSFDPHNIVQVSTHVDNEGEDIVVVGERGPVACRDYPHARHLCVKFPFKTTSHEKHCEQCHCYVCDVLAPCLLWGQGKHKTDHCHAFDKDEKWKMMRDRARTPPAKLVGKPRVIQPAPYIPFTGVNNSVSYNYHSAYHSSLDLWASTVNVPPPTQGRSRIRVTTTSLLSNIPSHLVGPSIEAPIDKVRFHSSSRPNTILNRPSGMGHTVPRHDQSSNFRSCTRARGTSNHAKNNVCVARPEKSRMVSETLNCEDSSGLLPPAVSIINDFLTLEALVGDGVFGRSGDQRILAQRSNVNSSGGIQVELRNSGEVAPSDSLKISSSRLNELEAQPIQTLDPRGTDQANRHIGNTNNITSESTDSNRAEGEVSQVNNNTGSPGMSELFGVGSATEVLDDIFANFGNEEFPYLWEDML